MLNQAKKAEEYAASKGIPPQTYTDLFLQYRVPRTLMA
ncbi:hypothetical protein LINPERPRIM_LOCUS30252 [Linum perenne]